MTGNSRGTKGNIKEGKGRERDGLGTLEKTQQMYDIVLCKYRTRGQKSYWILLEYPSDIPESKDSRRLRIFH